MFRGGDPILHDLVELVGGHARVRNHNDLPDGRFAAGERAFHVALEQRRKWLLVFPFRMLRRQRFHPIEREKELEVHRLLTPERAVVVEGRDALVRWNEVGRTFLGNLRDEFSDGFLRRAVVPRRQRVLGLDRSETGEDNRQQDKGAADGFHGFGFSGVERGNRVFRFTSVASVSSC